MHEYFKTGQGNGKLTNYILDPQGECQVSITTVLCRHTIQRRVWCSAVSCVCVELWLPWRWVHLLTTVAQESGRDQSHTQLGIFNLVRRSVAWRG